MDEVKKFENCKSEVPHQSYARTLYCNRCKPKASPRDWQCYHISPFGIWCGMDAENNLLAVSGAVPGRRGTLLEIRG